jgi:hypothetical protein
MRSLQNAWKSRYKPPEGMFRRGFEDAKRVLRHWSMRGVAALLTTGFAIWSASLPDEADWKIRVGLAAAAYLGGAVIVAVVAFMLLALSAPLRQRNEAQRQLGSSKRLQEQIIGDLVQQSHGFTSILRARASKAASKTGSPTPEERTEVPDWQRRFPGNQQHQDGTVAQIIEKHREQLYVLFDAAAAAGIETAEDRRVLRLLSTVDEAWYLSDRIVVLAEQWNKDALLPDSPPVILPERPPSPAMQSG